MKSNIFNHDKIPVNGEIFEVLLKEKNIVIEKILSSNILPEKEYIQDYGEWVFLVQGEAEMLIDNKNTSLRTGDYIFIGSGVPHKVLKTMKGTVWLAVRIY